MTCIVAVAHEGGVIMGADSAGVEGWNMTTRTDAKVFEREGFLFGFTSSFRMGQVLRHSFHPPMPPPIGADDLSRYMVVQFVDAVRECLKAAGFAKKENEVESGGIFLVGYAGRIFKIEADYQVGESQDPYMATGGGEAYALGALYATQDKDPWQRVKIALKAAEAHNMGVRGPFILLTQTPQPIPPPAAQ